MKNFWQRLKKPFLVLAPMEGVTDFVFREIVATELPKPHVMMTEFTNVESLMSKGFEKTIIRFKFSEKQRPIIAQIWGMNPENYYKSAKLITKLGFDGIDINMGCPVREVFKMGVCSALINNRPLAKEIIDSVKKGANGLPISIKIRIGIKEVVTEDWAGFLLEQKIEALIIHGRTVEQMSKVPADWNEIGKVVKLRNKISPETMIIGNGDVNSYEDAEEKHNKFGVDGVMIGRGIFHNPWVFEKGNKNHTPEEYKDVLIKHLNLYEKTYGDGRNYHIMKKFYKMYVNNFKGANQLRIKLMSTNNFKEAQEILS
ncbi:hypothetical protein A2767_05220 [Candidatus Roizmanbacteria bacterium RIFCSPHIGHO2_01_FULL_35_10]|uniref:tRNA-dihydrouridine synthase n=1 Tax=Candidatus Roizmanbacteria bacterium RIFCSPLOWO2_01_FULL_35_13 TaxID=1802055 RepID=A0A1F7IBV8_9BACT|nr:MAG: hypothetical protein A2767_05220 [Candidatus Roizmanbacteria bacterium RIFCSPHIGHO2_01_FULL_35_10]OGK40851.1 MAG: hypothetical protein A3A74_05905 [Candidatus Roizmanbacteria bacterium RIFCSPLOWO2_01_FULL_35_13]